jgi:hypothetical protein
MLRKKINIPRPTAWKKLMHIDIHFFQNLFFRFRFLQNILRDFQKMSNFKKLSLSRQNYHQIQSNTAKKSYAMTRGSEKWKKSTTQIFHFWNFVTEIFAKHIERFSKNVKL